MTPTRLVAVLAILLTTGCAASKGLPPEQLRDILTQEEARFVGPQQPEQPSAGSASRASARSLGLYLKPTGFLNREFEWTDRDRETVLTWAKGVQASGPATSAGFVPLSSLKGHTLTELRASGARYGFDFLVVFDGAAAVDRYNNYKGPLLYWTILGAYFADGTQSDALCVVKGSVWDVKTGAQLHSEEAEGRSQMVGPAAFVDDDWGILKARQEALTELLAKLKSHLTRLRNP
jgi:hypothetical protein